MRLIFAVIVATLFGLFLRVLFGFFENTFQVMSMAIFFLAPFLIGFVTVFLLDRTKKISGTKAFFTPWLTCLLLLFITIKTDQEGSICWVMIFPVFIFMASIGGIIAHGFMKSQNDNINKPNKLNLTMIFVLPIVVGAIEGDRGNTVKHMEMQREVIINASTADVWFHLTNINEIQKQEQHSGPTSLLGFPKHTSTVLDTAAVGGKRIAYYERGLYFNETIKELEPEHMMALDIKTEPDKIPPTVMDEHILIGGEHLDIHEDTYRLRPMTDGKCKLSITTRFMICTPANWYSAIWARYLMNDMLTAELQLIKSRAEK